MTLPARKEKWNVLYLKQVLQVFVRQWLYFFPYLIRFYKYPAVFRCVLICPSAVQGCAALAADKQPAAANDSTGIFGTFFTLHWLRAHRVIISRLCSVALSTACTSLLLPEISQEFLMIWGEKNPSLHIWLMQGYYQYQFLVSLFWNAFSEFWAGYSIGIGDDKQLCIFLDIKGILAHICVEGTGTFEDG